MTINVELYVPMLKRSISSPMNIIGLSSGCLPLPFAREYLTARPIISSEAARVGAILFHTSFNGWCRGAFSREGLYGPERPYGSDPEGFYIPEEWSEETKAAYQLTLRLLGIYTTAAALGFGLKFSY